MYIRGRAQISVFSAISRAQLAAAMPQEHPEMALVFALEVMEVCRRCRPALAAPAQA